VYVIDTIKIVFGRMALSPDVVVSSFRQGIHASSDFSDDFGERVWFLLYIFIAASSLSRNVDLLDYVMFLIEMEIKPNSKPYFEKNRTGITGLKYNEFHLN